MKQLIQLLVISTIIGVFLLLSGCTEETTAPKTEPAPPTAKVEFPTPKGTITGKIHDVCTEMAISGAVLSTGYDGEVHTVTSDASGSFSFANVPAGNYSIIGGSTVLTGTYVITASLVGYNAAQTDLTKRYREYYYRTVDITFTSLVPGDSMGVAGLVGAVEFDISALSATLKGTVVNQDMQPAADARVTLKNNSTMSVYAQTRTAADGSYQFANTESGYTYYIEALSSDGSMEGTLTYYIQCNLPQDSLRAQVSAERIMLAPVDNVAPYVTSITPENNSDVSTTVAIVYTFSEPIAQNAYTNTTLGAGHSTIIDDITVTYVGLKKALAALPRPTVAWNLNYTTLTITPSGLTGSAKYTVSITPLIGKLKDKKGNTLVANTIAPIVGDNEVLNFSTAGGSPVPAAPVLKRTIVPLKYLPLDYIGGNVLLIWYSDSTARSYTVYSSVNGGSFDVVVSDLQVTEYLAASGGLFVGALNNPLRKGNVKYKITAWSKDRVESAESNIITVVDEVKPQLLAYPPYEVAPGTNNYVYTLGFSEPLSQLAAETIANYTMSAFGGVSYTINSATYAGYDAALPAGARYKVLLYVTSTGGAPVPGYTLTVTAGLTDLAGNNIDTGFNSHVY